MSIYIKCEVIILCPKLIFQGEYFNDEEVRRMLAAEAAEEKLKREEELIKEEEMAKEANQEEGKRKKRGIVIAP